MKHLPISSMAHPDPCQYYEAADGSILLQGYGPAVQHNTVTGRELNVHEDTWYKLNNSATIIDFSAPWQSNQSVELMLAGSFHGAGHGDQQTHKKPTLQKPKRRKHRPKVVVERKARKRAVPETPKRAGDSQKRAMNLTSPFSSSATPISTEEICEMRGLKSTCRRSLSFPVENKRADNSGLRKLSQCITAMQNGCQGLIRNGVELSELNSQNSHGVEVVARKQRTDNALDLQEDYGYFQPIARRRELSERVKVLARKKTQKTQKEQDQEQRPHEQTAASEQGNSTLFPVQINNYPIADATVLKQSTRTYSSSRELGHLTITVAPEEGNRIIPFNWARQRMLIPYNPELQMTSYPPDRTKPRQTRSKVDLDEETSRMWKMLMWNDGIDGTDEGDEEKEKQWKHERHIFHSRVQTFIARMHNVQGNRRFSQWKGSVVDSVIGVFLTQNVSDHLSSSAFMALAAKFPLRSGSNNGHKSEHVLDAQNNHDETLNQAFCRNKPQSTGNDQTANVSESSDNIMFLHETLLLKDDQMAVFHPNEDIIDPLEDEHLHIPGLMAGTVYSQMSPPISQNFTDLSIQEADETRSILDSNFQAENALAVEGVLFNELYDNRIISFTDLLQMQQPIFCQGHNPPGSNNPASDLTARDVNMNNSGQTFDLFAEALNPSIYFSSPHQVPTAESLLCTEISLAQMEPRSSEFIVDEMRQSPLTYYDFLNMEKRAFSKESHSNEGEDVDKSMVHPLWQATCTDGSCTSHSKHPQHVAITSERSTHDETYSFLWDCITPRMTLDYSNTAQTISSPTVEKIPETKLSHSLSGDKATTNSWTGENANDWMHIKKPKIQQGREQAPSWDSLRKQICQINNKKDRDPDTLDSVDYKALRCANVNDIAATIRERGMNNILAQRIKDFLDRLVYDHGSMDLEWLRDAPSDKSKEYLLSIRGLGLKSVECVRLLALHHRAFPVDTNVGRICVRLGWVPLRPLPESLQLHLLELYPLLESIQKYLWPRLCKLDQRTLYELHYQMITFGKVFCTKSKPNCNACPMRAECRHFASAFASARLALPAPEEKILMASSDSLASIKMIQEEVIRSSLLLSTPQNAQVDSENTRCEPIIEEPVSPVVESLENLQSETENAFWEETDEIPTIKLNIEEFSENMQDQMQVSDLEFQGWDMSRALVALRPEIASIPVPKLKNASRLRTEHLVYELPDSHVLLKGLDLRELDDPCPYLLVIWTREEDEDSTWSHKNPYNSVELGTVCRNKMCSECSCLGKENAQPVSGTLLIPCRTAMRGSFPLNGTYFQVNEVFADHDSSHQPIDIPRSLIWNLPRRIVYFGTSIPTIFRGLSTEAIQQCFWRGYVCVRGFDRRTRAPRPLTAGLHFPASKLVTARKGRGKVSEKAAQRGP